MGWHITGLQLVLAMAHNLSVGTSRKIDPKSAKKCLKVQRNCFKKGVILVLLSHTSRELVSPVYGIFCHLGKGEGNENRKVYKVYMEGRRGQGNGEDRGVGRGESAGGRLT